MRITPLSSYLFINLFIHSTSILSGWHCPSTHNTTTPADGAHKHSPRSPSPPPGPSTAIQTLTSPGTHNYSLKLLAQSCSQHPLFWLVGALTVCWVTLVSDSLPPDGQWTARLLHPWDSPGKNTGVGCHVLLQGIFVTQGLNPVSMSPSLAGRLFTARPPGC